MVFKMDLRQKTFKKQWFLKSFKIRLKKKMEPPTSQATASPEPGLENLKKTMVFQFFFNGMLKTFSVPKKMKLDLKVKRQFYHF